MDFEKRLSPTQYAAATHLAGPVCVLAGAGSGKTRVITHRIAWLILEKHVQPETILAVTFTNKAAGEMKERVGRLVPGRGFKAQIGTFHGLAARILRKWGRAVGMTPSFVIYDEDDWHRLLTRIVVNDLNLEKDTTRGIGALIDSWQCEGLLPPDVPQGHDFLFDKALEAYRISRERLDQMGAIDFGGLLLKLRELLTKSEVAHFVKEGIRHVLVDEYQDVNRVQADIVLALAKEAVSVAVVGDDDQAIYGWRGASAANLRKFLDAVPNAELVKLEENYRSTATILEAANGIIAKNAVRLGKVLRPTGERGRSVRVIRAYDDLEEARRVVSDILEHARQGTSLDEIAVLYRTNSLSRPFEDELRRSALPYRVVGGVRFYDRKEVKDVLATVRCALNPGSDVDTLRFLAAVPRGIGDTTVNKLDDVGKKRHLSLLAVMGMKEAMAEAGLAERAQVKCLAVAQSVRELGAKIGRPLPGAAAATQQGLFDAKSATGAKEAIALAVQVSGVADRLEAENSIESEGRLENLGQLVSAAAEWALAAREEGEPDDVVGFLESASLLSSTDERKDGRGQVTLMSLHAAKGLEFEVVYLAGLEEHLFPHSRAIEDGARGDELEEERRLAYVGITRAKRRLVLSYADWRMVQGMKKRRTPSRFLHEIPREVLDGDVPSRILDQLDVWRRRQQQVAARDPIGTAVASVAGRDPGGEESEPRVEYDEGHSPAPARVRFVVSEMPQGEVAPTFATTDARRFELGGLSPLDADDNTELGDGKRVWHRLFGRGTIVGLRGRGPSTSALVRFDDERQVRVIILRHLRAENDAPPSDLE